MICREIDFSRWAVVSMNDDTGLGRMAQDVRAVLGLGHHLVAPSERMASKPLGPGDFPMTRQTSAEEIRTILAELDGLILLERPSWNESLLSVAREMGVASVTVPMWEWFNLNDPHWAQCDLLACPNRKCLEVVRQHGFTNSAEIAWPLDLERLPKRKVSGPARVFVHNAGLMDHDDRKGTADAIEAFGRVRHPELRLIVRLQKDAPLRVRDERVTVQVGNLPDIRSLWNEGDAALQPSKLEGIGFMVLEPVCAGLPVITVDAAPMNEYPVAALAQPRWFARRAFASQWVPHARLRPANIRSLAGAIEECSRRDLAEASERQRAWAEERFEAAKVRQQWAETLSRVVRKRTATA